MIVLHIVLVILGSILGWDIVKRLLPVHVPGVVARVVIAAIAGVLWAFAPMVVIVSMSTVAVLSILAPYLSGFEAHSPWGSKLVDLILGKKQQLKQKKTERVVKQKLTDLGKRFTVTDKIGKRIPKL